MSAIARIDMKDVYLYLVSRETAEGDPYFLGFRFLEGEFSFTVAKGFEFIPDRGILQAGTVRENDEVPCDISFSGEFNRTFIPTGDETLTPYELLMQQGTALPIRDSEGNVVQAGWVGMNDNICEPYATELWLINDPEIRKPGCVSGEYLHFAPFFCESAEFNTKNGTCSFKGKMKRVGPIKETVLPEALAIHNHG